MSLQTRLEALVAAIGADVKAVNTSIGNLASLLTTDKSSLVAAINEVRSGTFPWVEQIRTTDYTNSTTTASDVFTGFAPVGNGRYLIEATLAAQAAAITTGVQVGVTSGGPLVYSAMHINTVGANNALDYNYRSAFGVQGPSPDSLTTPSIINVVALVEIGTTPLAGNTRIQAKSEVAASLITIKAGSLMRWRKLN